MILGPATQRAAWGISWLSAALAAIALAMLVHLVTAQASLWEALPQIALCSLGSITLSVLCVTSAALALISTPNVPATVVRSDRWEPIHSAFAEGSASRAA